MNTTPLTFRKSSFSDNNGGACVEVAFRKSSFSDNNAAECVEVAGTLDVLRDSKNPGTFLAVNLKALLTAVKSDRLDR